MHYQKDDVVVRTKRIFAIYCSESFFTNPYLLIKYLENRWPNKRESISRFDHEIVAIVLMFNPQHLNLFFFKGALLTVKQIPVK